MKIKGGGCWGGVGVVVRVVMKNKSFYRFWFYKFEDFGLLFYVVKFFIFGFCYNLLNYVVVVKVKRKLIF